MLLVKPSITSRTCLNFCTPQDPLSTCWHNALSVPKSLRQFRFGHLYILWAWTGLPRCWLRRGSVLNVEWHMKHSYACSLVFHESSVAHDGVFVGALYPPCGPAISREGFVITLFLSVRTTRRSSCARVMPDGQVPDSKWRESAEGEMNDLLQPRPGHEMVLGRCVLEFRCCWRLF